MGWTYLPLGRHGEQSTPKSYFDAQLTYERGGGDTGEPFRGARVLKSTCSSSLYHAAIERYDEIGVSLDVFAAIFLVRYNPKATDGLTLGYKDMEESMGPSEACAPRSVLERLSPSDNPVALNWRRRCYRRLRLTERKLTDGALIKLASPLTFTDGSKQSEFRVHKTGSKVHLTRPDGGGGYRISRLMERAFEVIEERPRAKTFFPKAA